MFDVHRAIQIRNLLGHGGHLRRGGRSVRRIVGFVGIEGVCRTERQFYPPLIALLVQLGWRPPVVCAWDSEIHLTTQRSIGVMKPKLELY